MAREGEGGVPLFFLGNCAALRHPTYRRNMLIFAIPPCGIKSSIFRQDFMISLQATHRRSLHAPPPSSTPPPPTCLGCMVRTHHSAKRLTRFCDIQEGPEYDIVGILSPLTKCRLIEADAYALLDINICALLRNNCIHLFNFTQ